MDNIGTIVSSFIGSMMLPRDKKDRIVLPTSRRQQVLELARVGSSFRSLKTDLLVPSSLGMLINIVAHVQSVRLVTNWCQKSTMVVRPVISVPFESVALDLVSSLPRGKRGYKSFFTYVCLATRWPEVIPLKYITAQRVTEGLVEIFCR